MDTLSAVSALRYSEKELVSSLLLHATENHVPIALWRLPDSGLKHLIISDTYRPLDKDELLEELKPGFLMAPFDRAKSRLFIPGDLLLTFENGHLKTNDAALTEATAQWLRGHLRPGTGKRTIVSMPSAPQETKLDQTKESFIEMVKRGLIEIEKGTFEKIVPSRRRAVNLPDSFDVTQSFQKLCAAYPQALISFVSIPGVGSWLGASPEVLVGVRDRTIFKTVALAGTLPYHEGTNIKSVAWTQKEIEEQALVERYVISCFKKIRLREYEEHGPRTVVAGNLMHLKSEFTVDMKATNFPQMGSVMLDLLHPTSAVCGMPLEPSLQFLKENEAYDRGFYAGYLGAVNVHNNIDLFVNLRCMQISGNQGIVYAGAGITVDSDPDKEWAETEMKFNTLLNVIL